jgi:septal ring factor EnvC (AmiA/AmiB activator)
MEVAGLITIGVLAAALGIVLGRYVWSAVRASDRDALAQVQTEVARLNQECLALRSRVDQLDAERKAAFRKIENLVAETLRAAQLLDRLDQATLAKAFRGKLVEPQRTVETKMVISQ